MSNEIKKDIDNKAEFAKELQKLSEKHKCTIVGIPQLVPAHDGSFVTRVSLVVEEIK